MPYTKDKPSLPETSEQLRARIPGWGADLDPADRPSGSRERFDPGATGAHWDVPQQQPQRLPRERSIEHGRLTPVFGTAQPLHGPSGAVRRYAYRRFSEGRLAHWLLLVLGDRMETAEARMRSYVSRRPDNPLAETGLIGEFRSHGLRSRAGRVDRRHQLLDLVVVAGPTLLRIGIVTLLVRRVVRAVVKVARSTPDPSRPLSRGDSR
ncbi:MAG: hypothetical protein JO147_14455 [Actinobacteria bacterium]|nr:hypothetical protein [Actinomycetota bacterium]